MIVMEKEPRFIHNLLTSNEKVNANTLLVEGWIPDYALPMAYQEFSSGNYEYIVTSGMGYNTPLRLYTNSFLIFKPNAEFKSDTSNQLNIIELEIQSSIVRDDSCRYCLWLNNTMEGTFYVDKKIPVVQYSWYGSISKLDSILIQFNSDRVDKRGDRNLIINDVRINHQSLVFKNASITMDKGRPFGMNRRNLFARSYAELAANYFLDQGVPKEKILIVTDSSRFLNRTLGSAIAIKKKIKAQHNKIRGINIISQDYHSYRSLIVFRKILGRDMPVGVISIPLYPEKYSTNDIRNIVLKEFVAIIYYSLFIFPIIWIIELS